MIHKILLKLVAEGCKQEKILLFWGYPKFSPPPGGGGLGGGLGPNLNTTALYDTII